MPAAFPNNVLAQQPKPVILPNQAINGARTSDWTLGEISAPTAALMTIMDKDDGSGGRWRESYVPEWSARGASHN